MESIHTTQSLQASKSLPASRTTTTLVKLFLLLQILNLNQILALEQALQQEDNPLLYDTSSLYKATSGRNKRSTTTASQFVDACQSKVEVITPYYARNSKGKLRTIVNSEQMQQAIQIESCVRSPPRQQVNGAPAPAGCSAQNNNCFCEQKYKWHRLLVLDSKDSQQTRGLFMDWFLFPSSCSCRCRFNPGRIFKGSATTTTNTNTNTNKQAN